jgi:uncharacterized protein
MTKNKITDNLEYSSDKGLISFKGVRYLILRPETIMTMYKNLRSKYGNDVDIYFFQGGFEGGRLSSEKYRDHFGLNEMELIDFVLETGGEIGWGKFDLVKYDKVYKFLDVKVSNSAFVTKDNITEFPVCHFIRGVLSGMASVLFSSEIISNENNCAAKGDNYCLFSIKGL